MLHDSKYRLIGLCALILITSCSRPYQTFSQKDFGKRKYLKGRYVQLKEKNSTPPCTLDIEPTDPKEDEAVVALAEIVEKEGSVSPRVERSLSRKATKKRIREAIKKQRSELAYSPSSERQASIAAFEEKSIPVGQDEAPVTHWGAVAGLVCGILGIIGLFLFPPVGLLTIPALVFGSVAKTTIKAYPERFKGLGMAQAAFVLGIIGVGLIVLATILVIIYFSNFTFE